MKKLADPPIHADLLELDFLLGTWRGEGNGSFHTVDPFRYHEEISFSHQGRRWLLYDQRAWSPDDGELLHIERGFWTMVDEHEINTFVSLTAGIDFSEGTVDGTSISVEKRFAPMADGIERVEHLSRSYQVDGDQLSYRISMGTDHQQLTTHLEGRLNRIS